MSSLNLREKRTSRLDRKLAAYTLAATAAAVAPIATHAENISYFGNINQTVSYNSTTSTSSTDNYTLDLPVAGQNITFQAGAYGNYAIGSSGVAFLQGPVQLTPGGTTTYPAALAFGDTIDPTATANFDVNSKLASANPDKGNFPLNGEAYLGYYFTAADGLHAGWADLSLAHSLDSVGNDAYSLTLNSYAYENDPNTAIQAGAGVTPEPASISLIAMGAAGLAELRRRRRKYAEAA